MKNLFVLLLLCTTAFLMSCNNEDEEIPVQEEQLIFGHFYGECGGEQCVEIFKLTREKLFEDTNDTYPHLNNTPYEGVYVELTSEQFDLALDLLDELPSGLFNFDNITYGCPDCADGGGLYLEYHKDGETNSWFIDQDKNMVPAFLHDYMDRVNEVIQRMQ